MLKAHTQRAFTIIELLVVVSIIALLVGILLPAIGKAREQANLTKSQANLRQIAIAHQTYGAEFADRQFTLIDDLISTYGGDYTGAVNGYASVNGFYPPIGLGQDANGGLWILNAFISAPYSWSTPFADFGSFRIINAEAFNQYVGGSFIDPVFYAPKDRVVTEGLLSSGWEESPGTFDPSQFSGSQPWSSYVLSPAAMYNPAVFAKTGFIDPWSINAGHRCPSFSDALFPELKTHMLEHHWLQNAQLPCNDAFAGGNYDGCEPYYFNHAQRSQPVTLFYDGHIQAVGVRQAEQDNVRNINTSGFPLWSPDTPNGVDGYFMNIGYDFSETSFHIFTTEGIRGRDILK